jgi:hypothetical protein
MTTSELLVQDIDHPIAVQVGFAHRFAVRLRVFDLVDRLNQAHESAPDAGPDVT